MAINKNHIIFVLLGTIILAGIFSILPVSSKKILPSAIQSPDNKKEHIETPEIVRAIYLTSSSANNAGKIEKVISLAKNSQLNSVVIDIKDFSGYISYDSSVADAEIYKTERIDIKDIDSLLKNLHDSNIYVIARMTVFQDPALVKARPDWAVQNKYTKRPWTDRKGLSWIDPTCRECWNYYSSLAKDALERGFDEINFDYIRFPSDGDMEALVFKYWGSTTTRRQVLKDFFGFMRNELGEAKMSADLFGFVTTRQDDFGVGQVIEDAFDHFDFISPMVYPSHYPPGFLKFDNPAAHPYEVIYFTVKSAGERLSAYKQKTGNIRPNIRPWLQDFNLGADYTQAMVEAEIKATQEALGGQYKGFMLWNAKNVYHEGVF